ncbi:MAG: hypothetical protein GFH27_549349n91 [Chloroflexi bacterium AL-W]|nr:hypothetical protein [Chloroflexi bacterium AL-N1]NOK69989.1 hypothetical protein [Chloroflexi bacterium AL-N10]NOK73713.1 hypothetical protein [Chloroflexi bacterium AL-N5]NOK85521.1 hypothetical protein [Chloroflexi bacterium AL-W]NOK91722.1 hypothetical protein [Chloroflexi bacterium AL-N15]
MNQPTIESVPPWKKALAYMWYGWGLSLCYWGIRTSEQSFYRAGTNSFDRALHYWPQLAQVYYRRGLIRGRELHNHRAGIADMTTAIELSPDWPEPYLQRGLFQRFHGDPQAALSDLRYYLTLAENSSWRIEAENQIRMLEEELQIVHTPITEAG